MKKILLVVCFVPALAFGANQEAASVGLGTLLNEVALNAAAASRTFTIGPTVSSRSNLAGFKYLLLEHYFDHNANGAITTTCTGGGSVADSDYALSTCTVASGTCTLNWSGVVTTPTLSADKKYSVVIGILGHPVIKCVVSHGGTPGASDKITVTGYVVGN